MNELRIGSQVDCYRWQMAHLEEGSVYPGHPLVLATIVMFAFDDFESADEATEHGWCRALADSRIPGAGDHVGAAMRVLGMAGPGGTPTLWSRKRIDIGTGGRRAVTTRTLPRGGLKPRKSRRCFEGWSRPGLTVGPLLRDWIWNSCVAGEQRDVIQAINFGNVSYEPKW